MEKRISYDQFQTIKRVAQACNPLIVKRDKIKAKIDALTAEYNDYDVQIASLEAGIRQIIGFRVEQLVKKVMEPGIDANGQPKKTTKYIPTDIVSYDASKKQFVISSPEDSPEEDCNGIAEEYHTLDNPSDTGETPQETSSETLEDSENEEYNPSESQSFESSFPVE